MRIDVHAHYWTDDYLDLLVDLGYTDTGTQRGSAPGAAMSSRPGCVSCNEGERTCRYSPPRRNCHMEKTATRQSLLPAS